MKMIFEIVDKSGRKIYLSKGRWSHIATIHRAMTNYLEEIKQALENPLKITLHKKYDLRNYYLYIKYRKYPDKFLKVIVKYLNSEGFVITSHFVRNIK